MRISIHPSGRSFNRSLFVYGVASLFVFTADVTASFAQGSAPSVPLGTVKEFTNSFPKTDPSAKKFYALQVTADRVINVQITDNNCTETSCFVFGKVEGHEQATFFIKGDGKSLNGKVIFRKTK